MSRESDPDKPWCFPEGSPDLPGADPGNKGCFPESPRRGRRRGPFDLILPR